MPAGRIGQVPAARGRGTAPGQPGVIGAGPIMGVISRSTAQSLRLYNGRGRYNEWAFVAVAATQQPGAPTGTQTPGMPGRGGPGGVQQPGARPGGPGRGPGRGVPPPGRGFPGRGGRAPAIGNPFGPPPGGLQPPGRQ